MTVIILFSFSLPSLSVTTSREPFYLLKGMKVDSFKVRVQRFFFFFDFLIILPSIVVHGFITTGSKIFLYFVNRHGKWFLLLVLKT